MTHSTPNAKRTRSTHMSSNTGSDLFDPTGISLLNPALGHELETCYQTAGRLEDFPDYTHFRPQSDTALETLLESLNKGETNYEQNIVQHLNDYLHQVSPNSSFRCVHLDCYLNAQKLRLDIGIVDNACLDEELQRKRAQAPADMKSKSRANLDEARGHLSKPPPKPKEIVGQSIESSKSPPRTHVLRSKG